jgi:hypothetical protein
MEVDVPGKNRHEASSAVATLHFLALVDILESTGEQALHGTGRRWSVLTTNSVAKLSKLKKVLWSLFMALYANARNLPKAPNVKEI